MMKRENNLNSTFTFTSEGGSDAPVMATQTDGITTGIQVKKDGMYRITYGVRLRLTSTTTETMIVVNGIDGVNGSYIPATTNGSNVLNWPRTDLRNKRVINNFTTLLKLQANGFVYVSLYHLQNGGGAIASVNVQFSSFISVEWIGN